MSENHVSSAALFPHPFSAAYWKQAVSEFKNTRVMVFAALMIALRVIFKTISIPIGMDLRINTAFIINAFGAMVFGPVVAAAAAAVTDTLGCILFPTGTYFFPFIFIEIAGSVIFALFLYRTNITCTRIILSRFCIDFFVNIVLNTPIMMLYYQLIMGKYYAPFDLMRIIKNLVLFPIESVILILLMDLIVPRLKSLGFTVGSVQSLKLNKRTISLLAALFLAGCAAVTIYLGYAYEHTSLSASYSSEERAQKNRAMTEESLSHLSPDASYVSIIESAYPSLFSDRITHQIAIYELDEQKLRERSADSAPEENLAQIYAYSKTPASKDEALTRLGSATVVTQKDGTVLSYEDDLPDPEP